jgi:hypothetical protein
MTPTSLIIVPIRESLRVNKPRRRVKFKVGTGLDVTDAHGKLIDRVTDLAALRGSDGAGMHQASIAETKWKPNRTPINKQLADQITKIAKSNGGGWSFAAPPPATTLSLNCCADVRNRIVEFVKSDLVKVEPAKLASHFRSLQPI